ncbi:hydrolase [Vibrio sp. MACH09]|uniref:DUF3413 domain-containing protein n=1 Tax=unclassified Vibrio TaxID=2614977 RepID=UPI0014935AFD|nr:MULTISPECIES: DUF3413 domain-containing protein [unclassified Vibrio]NOI65661.1 DUF3413 domain-containing protein [Vibrio sp. 99-8-1]GLO61446.1 hydrolase [Vibrio sp. MACH09]
MVDSGNTYGERVSRLVSWGHWFSFFNIVAAMLIGTRYIAQSPWPETLLGQAYLVLSWLGHFSFLVFALYLLILFPLTFVIPSKKLFRFVSVCFATVGLTLLLLDTQAYQQVSLHLNPVVWELLLENDQSNIATELQQLFIVLPVIFLLQLALSEWIWHKQRKLSNKRIGRTITSVFFISFIFSHLIYMWADVVLYNPVTVQKANFPLSYPMTAKSFMQKHGLFDREEYIKKQAENDKRFVNLVSYPIEPLTFDNPANKLNVLMIVVDNLRADALTAEKMPHTQSFAKDNINFSNHYSSGNSGSSLFGLFYGIPNSYRSSIEAQGTSPLMLDTLKNNGYQFSLISGSNFIASDYNPVVLENLGIELTNNNSAEYKDEHAINDWNAWLASQPNSPWYSYIELSTVENFEDYQAKQSEGSTEERLHLAYSQAVSKVDIKINTIIEQLKLNNLLDSTVVIITSNHGTEFNETKTNSWGSASNYSRYQLGVPLVIHWPEKKAQEITYKSSHFDISVTLLQELMGVSSNPMEFSSGKNLFDPGKRRWVIAGGNKDIALITDDTTTVVDKYGNYKVYDNDYKRQKKSKTKLSILMQGLSELKRFYSREID